MLKPFVVVSYDALESGAIYKMEYTQIWQPATRVFNTWILAEIGCPSVRNCSLQYVNAHYGTLIEEIDFDLMDWYL